MILPSSNTKFNDASRLLRFNLSSKLEYSINDPIIITFTLENLTDQHISVLKWYTPLEGFKGEFFLVTCNGKTVPYEGRLVKRADPLEEDYLLLGPNQSVHSIVNLADAYNLRSSSPECKVEFKGWIYDVIITDVLIPRKMDDHSRIQINGNEIFFKVK
jgi:hypothetical protein